MTPRHAPDNSLLIFNYHLVDKFVINPFQYSSVHEICVKSAFLPLTYLKVKSTQP